MILVDLCRSLAARRHTSAYNGYSLGSIRSIPIHNYINMSESDSTSVYKRLTLALVYLCTSHRDRVKGSSLGDP